MRLLLHAALDSFAIVGGVIAVTSGLLAGVALILRRDVGGAVDIGVAIGGIWAGLPALVLFFLELSHAL
jgi:hypothetical protein